MATLDQPAYYEQLLERRPELMTQHGESVRDPAWQALVIRPAYREEILTTQATYADILAREYTPELRTRDAAWAESLRVAQRAFAPTATVRAGAYPIEAYSSYQVGAAGPLRDALGYSYKAFIEVADFEQALAPERYVALSHALEKSGFKGDSKIDLRPGQVRFQYNNVIVHAATPAMAQCAESVGLAFFGESVLHTARGVDAPPGPGEKATDWHHHLLRGGFARLPEAVVAFVRYQSPAAACPGGGMGP